jgi:hypothetical protein
MTADKTTAHEDLAFLRQILSPDQDAAQTRYFGQLYALWGMAFAVPLFMEWLRIIGLAPLPDYFWLASSMAVTIGIIIVTIVASRRARPALGMQARAANAVFAGVGFANIAVLVGLIFVAVIIRDGRVMMIHALVVFAFQGAAWYALWALRKRPFAGLVAGGWYLSAGVAGAAVARPDLFVLFCAVILVLLMVLPGLVMARSANPD